MQPRLSPEKYIQKVARKLPISATLVSKDIFISGLGQIVVAREKKNDSLVVGIYMVDVFACGVKDSFFKIMDEQEFEKLLSLTKNRNMELETKDPNYVFNLVYGAVEYAEDLGLEPHKSFALTSYILEDVEDIEYVNIEFGKDGKPLYIPGINENPARVLAILNKNIGEGNYEYTIALNDYTDF